MTCIGSSSGIGLATTQLFLAKGATVIGTDLYHPSEAIDSGKFEFHKADVTSWSDLCEVFARVHAKHGRIDFVYANAGIGPKANYLELEQDSEGKLIEPTKLVLQINLLAVANQAALAAHYMQKQEPKGGSIVLTASCTGYQKFNAPDYVAAKHGVIGLMRSLSLNMNSSDVPIRINAVAPSFTQTSLVRLSDEDFETVGIKGQPASAVAKSVGLLVSDKSRHAQCLYSYGGRYVEMEEPVLRESVKAIGKTGLAEEDERVTLYKYGQDIASRSVG